MAAGSEEQAPGLDDRGCLILVLAFVSRAYKTHHVSTGAIWTRSSRLRLATFGLFPFGLETAMADADTSREGIRSAADAIEEELKAITARREVLKDEQASEDKGKDPSGDDTDEDKRLIRMRKRALRNHVVGLAFSGGGIRSGTFAVGFLQGLAS